MEGIMIIQNSVSLEVFSRSFTKTLEEVWIFENYQIMRQSTDPDFACLNTW